MRSLPRDVSEESAEFGGAPYPAQVLYTEMRGLTVSWHAGETAEDAVQRAAARRGVRQPRAMLAEAMAACVARGLASLTPGDAGGTAAFATLPPSIVAARAARARDRAALPALRAATRTAARAMTYETRRGPSGGSSSAERSDRSRHPERYLDYTPARPGRPPRKSVAETRCSPAPQSVASSVATGFEGLETRCSAAPAPDSFSSSENGLQGRSGGERERSDARADAGGGEALQRISEVDLQRISDPPDSPPTPPINAPAQSETPAPAVRLRTAEELAPMDDATLGRLVLDWLAERGELDVDADAEQLVGLGRAARRHGYSEELLVVIGGAWAADRGGFAAVFSWSPRVAAGKEPLSAGLLLGARTAPGVFKGTGLCAMARHARRWRKEQERRGAFVFEARAQWGPNPPGAGPPLRFKPHPVQQRLGGVGDNTVATRPGPVPATELLSPAEAARRRAHAVAAGLIPAPQDVAVGQ